MMTLDEAIIHGKEQLEVFGGEHREFIEMAIKALEQKPSTDCISRAEAIKGLGEQPHVWTNSNSEIQQLLDWREYKKMLEELPSVGQEPK